MAGYKKSYYLAHPHSAYREFIYWPIKNSWQLSRRGWADSDTWGLDHVLCGRLGAQLHHLAKTTHGWPDQEYDTPEEWDTALRENGQALIDYATRPGQSELLTKWHDLKFGKDNHDVHDWLAKINSHDDNEATEAAWKELRSLEEKFYDEAQKSLRWVADHFGHLWD